MNTVFQAIILLNVILPSYSLVHLQSYVMYVIYAKSLLPNVFCE